MKKPIVYIALSVYFGNRSIDVYRQAAVQNQNTKKIYLRQEDVLNALNAAHKCSEAVYLAGKVNVHFVEMCVDCSGVYSGYYAYSPKALYEKLSISSDVSAKTFCDFMKTEFPKHI